jgi:hypothetical protein
VKKLIILISAVIFLSCMVFSTLSTWESLSVFLFVFFFLEFLLDLGKRIVILDLAIILAIFTCLIMPAIFYHEYTRENHLARLWLKYMPISSDDYFSFTLPAIFMMILGFRVPLGKLQINKNPGIYIENVKKYLANKPRLGLILIGVGVTSGLLDFLSPTDLKQVFHLMDHLTYVGVFYVLYSPNKRKRVILPGVLALMVGQTIVNAMFGEFIFMLACSLVLILLGKKISFPMKLLYAFAGIFLIIVIQSVKIDYRKRSWLEHQGADPVYFAELITDRVTNPVAMFDANKLFFVAVRMNQGWLVAITMNEVPKKFPFANGETVWQSVAATIVPRILWPDKPEVGGKANLKRFWGYDIKGYSMNIGTLGEAYGNFDVTGGIVFMFFYGLFFNIVLSVILKVAERRPTVVLWLPFLFFYAIGIETDLLTTMGWLIKGVFFTWVTFKVFQIGFRIDL